MGFLFDGLDEESYDRNYDDGLLVKRILQYFKPQARQILFVSILVVLASIVNTATPIFVSHGLDQLQVDSSTRTLLQITLLVTAMSSMAWVFNWVRRRYSAEAIGDVVLKLREDAFDAILKRDLSFYDAIPSGKIVSRVTSDTQAFSQTVSLTIELLSQVMLVLILVGFLLTVNFQLTLVLLGLAPVIIAVALAFRYIARSTVVQARRMRAVVSAHIQETVAGISVAKTFRQERAIYDEFLTVNRQAFWIGLRWGWTFSAIFPILNLLSGLGTALLIFFGGRQAQAGAITAGTWYLFIQGMIIFWFPLTSIASFSSQFQQGLGASERVFALLDAEPKVVQRGNVKLGAVRGEIRFHKVNFSYNETETVLTDFSLTIPAGQTLALVGHTGA